MNPPAEFAVDEPDPTPTEWVDGSTCGETSLGSGWACTWYREDHPRWHVAGDGRHVCFAWPVIYESDDPPSV